MRIMHLPNVSEACGLNVTQIFGCSPMSADFVDLRLSFYPVKQSSGLMSSGGIRKNFGWFSTGDGEGFITGLTVGFGNPRAPPERCPQPLFYYFWTIQFCPKLAHHCSPQSSCYSVVQNPAIKWTPDCPSEGTLALTPYYFGMSFGVSSLTHIIYQNMACRNIQVFPLRGVLMGNIKTTSPILLC